MKTKFNSALFEVLFVVLTLFGPEGFRNTSFGAELDSDYVQTFTLSLDAIDSERAFERGNISLSLVRSIGHELDYSFSGRSLLVRRLRYSGVEFTSADKYRNAAASSFGRGIGSVAYDIGIGTPIYAAFEDKGRAVAEWLGLIGDPDSDRDPDDINYDLKSLPGLSRLRQTGYVDTGVRQLLGTSPYAFVGLPFGRIGKRNVVSLHSRLYLHDWYRPEVEIATALHLSREWTLIGARSVYGYSYRRDEDSYRLRLERRIGRSFYDSLFISTSWGKVDEFLFGFTKSY